MSQQVYRTTIQAVNFIGEPDGDGPEPVLPSDRPPPKSVYKWRWVLVDTKLERDGNNRLLIIRTWQRESDPH